MSVKFKHPENPVTDEKCCTSANQVTERHTLHEALSADDKEHNHQETSSLIPAGVSLVLLVSGLMFQHVILREQFKEWIQVIWYVAGYLPVGLPVVKKAIIYTLRGEVFTEFSLMSIATIGALLIGEYPEAVAVMLFYAIGEIFQNAAVSSAKRNIKALLDIRPDTAMVLRNETMLQVAPDTVQIGEVLQIMAGEKVPLDGEMLSEISTFNTSALTGESKPSTILQGETVLAGMVNVDKVIQIRVTKVFQDSALAKILFLVQEAAGRKAKTEIFIRRFAQIYTPIVVFLAITITILPLLFIDQYVFTNWLYRALIFLVISCPCALVISIPLGYFGGIGAASRKGILFKGSNYLDLITKVNTLVMDKTGTLTKGVFKVQRVVSVSLAQEEFIDLVVSLERHSNHPIAKAIVGFANRGTNALTAENIEEISGHGMKGQIHGRQLHVGNAKLMTAAGVTIDEALLDNDDTTVFVAIDGVFAGYFTISDEIKEDAFATVNAFKQIGVKSIMMLSGDKDSVVQKVSKALGIDAAYGDLLPEQKVEKLEQLRKNPESVIAFVGDGINDAPALALADIGIAMGGLGSDAAIETADLVIQTDQPSKIVTAIQIGKATTRIVWQNISLAFGVKLIVLILGAGGLATMWEAVFADVGVALLSIVNAVRLQRMKF